MCVLGMGGVSPAQVPVTQCECGVYNRRRPDPLNAGCMYGQGSSNVFVCDHQVEDNMSWRSLLVLGACFWCMSGSQLLLFSSDCPSFVQVMLGRRLQPTISPLESFKRGTAAVPTHPCWVP